MGKNNKKNEKTILTEDLFNANGNAQISNTILNESDDLKQDNDNLQNNNEDEVNIIDNVEINQFMVNSYTLNSDDEETNIVPNSDNVENILVNDEIIINDITNNEVTTLDNAQVTSNINNEDDNKEISKPKIKEKKKARIVKSIRARGFNDEQYYK